MQWVYLAFRYYRVHLCSHPWNYLSKSRDLFSVPLTVLFVARVLFVGRVLLFRPGVPRVQRTGRGGGSKEQDPPYGTTRNPVSVRSDAAVTSIR